MSNVSETLKDVSQVTIIGTGLLGGSIGLGLRAAGFTGRILGVGRRRETLESAVKLGCIDAGVMDVAESFAHAGDRCHMLVLATPISGFGAAMASIVALGRRVGAERLWVTDVGSTKAHVCSIAEALDAAERHAGGKLIFVGSHPMAGSEQHGPAAARADLFKHKPCVMTAGPYVGSPAALAVRGLWQTLGMRVIDMTPEEHDHCVALVSHLPHAVAALLVQSATRESRAAGAQREQGSIGGALEIASSGFNDTTRVASGDPAVWADIFESNREAVIDALDGFAERLATFRKLLARTDAREEVLEMLSSSKAERDRWIEWKRKQT